MRLSRSIRRFAALALALGAAVAHADFGPGPGEEFEREIKATLAPLQPDAVRSVKLVHLSADVGPWLDTGIVLRPGEQVSLVMRGGLWLSRHYGLRIDPALAVWARIGARGEVFRSLRDTGTLQVREGGALQLKLMPSRWLDRRGGYQGELAPPGPDGGGGVSVALVVWKAGVPVEAGLARLPTARPAWAGVELARPIDDVPPPPGWRYLWELGPASIFSVAEGAAEAGAPARRMQVHTRGDVAILQRDADFALRPGTRLQWRWKVSQLPVAVAEDNPVTHDYLSIAVEFDNGQDLTYMWSAALAPGSHFRCPLPAWQGRETHIVARSGSAELERWLAEERDVWADYRATVGGPMPGRITRVWLIANSVFQRGEGRAEFGEIVLSRGGRRLAVW